MVNGNGATEIYISQTATDMDRRYKGVKYQVVDFDKRKVLLMNMHNGSSFRKVSIHTLRERFRLEPRRRGRVRAPAGDFNTTKATLSG